MFKVLVKSHENEIVKTIECASERQAERVADGVEINLNHDKYYVEVIEE